VKKLFPDADYQASPYGEYFFIDKMPVCQGGWGKISAAASVQYVIETIQRRGHLAGQDEADGLH
jgi:hypothetical protein